MVRHAVELARPSAEAMLNTIGTTSGHKFVDGYVRAPGLVKDITFTFGDVKGDERFFDFAMQKLEASYRTGVPTSVLVAQAPWLLLEGENLYPGGVTENDVAVGVSGAKGITDESIAWIVLKCVVMLADFEVERRIKAEEMKI